MKRSYFFKKFHLFFVALLLIFFTSCKSNNFFKRNYFIENQEIQNKNLWIEIYNCSEKTISSFDIFIELNIEDSENYSSYASKKIPITQEILSNESINLNLNIQDLITQFENQQDNLDELEENEIYINRIFLTSINYSDGTSWKDKYGTWGL